MSNIQKYLDIDYYNKLLNNPIYDIDETTGEMIINPEYANERERQKLFTKN